MTFAQWAAGVPEQIKRDPLWKVTAYQLALFLSDLTWVDVDKLLRHRKTAGLTDQLLRACGSIHANISEGYSRSSGLEQARFYEYALGSARETRGWYHQSRHVLGQAAFQHRVQQLEEIIRLVLTMIAQRRGAARLTKRARP